MKRLLLVVVMMVGAGCEIGPGITCFSDADCPTWGRCELSAGGRGACVLRPVDPGTDAGSDAGLDAGARDAGVDAGTPVAMVAPVALEISQAGCGTLTTGTVTVQNTGSAALSVTASTGTSPFFSVAPSTGSVPAGQSLTLTVSINVPATAQAGTEYQGLLVVSTSGVVGRHEVPLTARASGVTLTLTPSVASFGVLPLSTAAAPLPLTLTNAGNLEATLTLSQPSDSQFSLNWTGSPAVVTLPPGASVSGLQAGFSASRTTPSSGGAALTVVQPVCGASVVAIPMSGQGSNGGVGVSTTDLFFGANGRVDCGTQAGSKTFVLTNTGNQAFSWTGTLSKGSSSPFTMSPSSGTVPANNGTVTLTLSTTAIPAAALTSEDAFGDIFTIVTDVANDGSHAINLHQTANGAILSLAPTAVNFGQVPVQNTASAPFAVVNQGNTSPSVSLSSDNPKFVTTPSGPLVAAAGASTPLTGTYSPGSSVVVESALVQLSLDGGEPLCAPLPAALSMTGQGTSGSVSYSPVALDFGAVNCGSTPTARTVTFRNTGNQAYTITPMLSRDAGSPYAVSMAPASGLVAADGGSLVLTVSPNAVPQTSAVTPNLYGDTLTVVTDVASDSPHDIPLRLTARGSIFAISTSSVNFGSVPVGVTANGQFTVSNTGNAPGALVFTPIAPAIFGMPGNALVAAASASILSATFSPAAQMTYSDMASISKTSATVLCEPLPAAAISLSGLGTAANVVGLSGSALNFGLVACGSTAAAQTLTVTNNSSNQLAFTFSLSGGASSPYTVTGPSSLAAGASGQVTVTPRAVPATSSTAPDAFAGTLSITGTGGPINESHPVALHETAQGAVLTLNPTTLSFTDGQSKNFTVNNSGNLAAPYTLSVGGSNPNSFSLTPTSGTAPAGGSVTEAASYAKPLLSGPQSATVTLSTAAGRCAPLPAALPLSGN